MTAEKSLAILRFALSGAARGRLEKAFYHADQHLGGVCTFRGKCGGSRVLDTSEEG